MHVVTKAAGKAVLLNDYEGMREVMEKFVRKIEGVSGDVVRLRSEISEVERETEIVKKKALNLRVRFLCDRGNNSS